MSTAAKIESFLRDLSEQHFYGAVTVKFENGRVCLVKTERSIKPEELPGQPGYMADVR